MRLCTTRGPVETCPEQIAPRLSAPALATGPTWGPPQNIDPVSADIAGITVNSVPLSVVSCPTTSFCMAIDSDDPIVGTSTRFAAFNGAGWSTPVHVTSEFGGVPFELTSVSCTSSSFCIAVDDVGDWFKYDGSSWTDAGDVLGAQGPTGGVSCASQNFCVLTATGTAELHGLSTGKKLLKESKKLKMTDITTFTPTGGKAVSRTTTFTLKS
jgi:hypothetical protein